MMSQFVQHQEDESSMKRAGKFVRRCSQKADASAADRVLISSRPKDWTLVFLFIAIVMSLVFLSRNVSGLGLLERSAFHWRKLGLEFSNVNTMAYWRNDEDTLKNILEKAAMTDNTVIVTTLNHAWATPNSMIDLFLESFHIGKSIDHFLKHLVILTLDQKAHDRCLSIHEHCFMLQTEGVDFSAEKFFMTDDYLKMMWRRIKFLRTILEMGYNFVFTDADVMWFRSPFPHFRNDADIHFACDHFTGSPEALENNVNGGFNFVKSNNRTIQFYKYWYMSHEFYPGKHDQDVLNNIKFDKAIKEMGLEIRFLDTAYFGGFCEPSKDLEEVCTMHANCCYGLRSKLHDVKMMLDDWKRFQSMTPMEIEEEEFTWKDPLQCRESEKLTHD